MMQPFYTQFKFANYAHLYQYCLFDALTHMAKERSFFDDFQFSFDIKNDGNLIYFLIPEDSFNLDSIKFTQKDVEQALAKLSTHLSLKVADKNLPELTKLLNETKPQKIAFDTILYPDDDSLKAPLLSFEDYAEPSSTESIYAEISADTPEVAVVASIILEPYLAAISREIQLTNTSLLAAQIGDQILLSSNEGIDTDKIIESAITELKKSHFQTICANNIDYLAAHLDSAKIFEYAGIVISSDKAESILRNADIESALRAITLA